MSHSDVTQLRWVLLVTQTASVFLDTITDIRLKSRSFADAADMKEECLSNVQVTDNKHLIIIFRGLLGNQERERERERERESHLKIGPTPEP